MGMGDEDMADASFGGFLYRLQMTRIVRAGVNDRDLIFPIRKVLVPGPVRGEGFGARIRRGSFTSAIMAIA